MNLWEQQSHWLKILVFSDGIKLGEEEERLQLEKEAAADEVRVVLEMQEVRQAKAAGKWK